MGIEYLNIETVSRIRFTDGTCTGKPLYVKLITMRRGILRRLKLMAEVVWIDEHGAINRRYEPHEKAMVEPFIPLKQEESSEPADHE